MYYALRENTPLTGIPADTEKIHLVRPLSRKRLRAILSRCPHLHTIGASVSVVKRLHPEARKLLEEKHVTLTKANRAGRAIHIDLETIREIADLRKDFLSMRKIAEKTGVAKSTIHYLLKKAKREKIRKGKNVIYVQ